MEGKKTSSIIFFVMCVRVVVFNQPLIWVGGQFTVMFSIKLFLYVYLGTYFIDSFLSLLSCSHCWSSCHCSHYAVNMCCYSLCLFFGFFEEKKEKLEIQRCEYLHFCVCSHAHIIMLFHNCVLLVACCNIIMASHCS